MSATAVRAELGKLMHATLADEAAHHDWTYHAVRPTSNPPRVWKPGMKIVGDCSKGVQFLCHWAPGCPDPMGNNWDVWGNSSTIYFHLHHLDHPSQLQVGDPVTFGRYGRDHAAMVMEKGNDPLLWSFGHPGAPNAYRLSWDRREHQLLSLMSDDPKPKPTPADKLRAQTGFYAWVSWRLGEGPWLHYDQMNPKVRPNVPKNIIMSRPTWFPTLAQFLAARKHGNKPTARVLDPG